MGGLRRRVDGRRLKGEGKVDTGEKKDIWEGEEKGYKGREP